MKAFLLLLFLTFVFSIPNVLRAGQIDCYKVYKDCMEINNGNKNICEEQFSLCIKNVH